MRSGFGKMLTLGTLIAGISIPSHAQYVGRVDSGNPSKTPPLRATAVLEYTGDVTKPVASRLVPVAVWDGQTYQPGGLYMAQPVPITVLSGTQYQLEVAGVPKGFFDVKAAADVSGSWIATGAYEKPVSPKTAKLRASRRPPQVIHDANYDDDKPHFAHTPTETKSDSGSTASNAPAVDPDRPQLHKRTDSGSNTGSGSDSSGNSGSSSTNSSASTNSNAPANSNAPPVDSDRPTLHRHSDSNPNDNGAPVSATTETDPDRPLLRRGRPENIEALDVPSDVEIAKLAGKNEDVEHMIAVSDVATHQAHNFVYSWSSPDDEEKAQDALESMAKNLLAGKPLHPATTTTAAPQKTAAKTTTTAAGKPAVHRTAKTPPATPLPDLADEQFKAFELTFGGGATLVFSAKSTMAGGKVKYVTMIAQPDFNGDPQVIFKQVTSEEQLDVIPRMHLVDAVDTKASNRGDLIFELAGKTDRQYAIYKVSDRAVEQVFSTAGNS